MARVYDDFRTNDVNVFTWTKRNANEYDAETLEDIYKVDEKEFIYRVLCQFSGKDADIYKNGVAPIRSSIYGDSYQELTWDYGSLILPETTQSNTVSYGEYKCLFFRPIMREFLNKQANFDMDTANEYASKVKQWFESGQIYVFESGQIDVVDETGQKIKKDVINLKPQQQGMYDFIIGKYPPVRIFEEPFKTNKFINIIGQDMVGANIQKIDKSAGKGPAIVEFPEKKSKLRRAVDTIKNFIRPEKTNNVPVEDKNTTQENDGK